MAFVDVPIVEDSGIVSRTALNWSRLDARPADRVMSPLVVKIGDEYYNVTLLPFLIHVCCVYLSF